MDSKANEKKPLRSRSSPIFELLRKYVIFVVFLLCVVIFGALNPKFLSVNNILNILWQNSYLVVASLGMAVLVISGATDLSAGYAISIGGSLTAAGMVWWSLPIWVAVMIGIIACILLSLLNGVLSIKLKINSLMVTLGTMTIFSGISNTFTQQKAIFGLPDSFKFIGQGSLFSVIPLPALIMTAIAVLIHLMLKKAYFGRYVYAVGSNAEAARLAGISVQRTRLIVFAIGGLLFGISAIMLTARSGSANASMAAGTEFTCLTAAVLGGVAIQGGEGKVFNVVVAAFILGILANGMQLIGLGTYAQNIAKGTILVAAMGFDTWQKGKVVKTRQH